ncbi:MAG: flagellar biosynthesis anti-sigma factor FlgM [Magnetococcales bacterium]|nr:flagellar biosynthesis anti-sigma factor FlgM [Magnetococcales bacterium]
MVTRIKGTKVGQLERISGRRVAKPKTGTTAKAKPRQDDVALSAISRTIGMAGEAASNAPEIRSELVEPIREALAAGRYNVSSLDVADKILRQILMERKKSA